MKNKTSYPFYTNCAEYPTDLSELHKLLDKASIKHVYREHPSAEGGANDIIGYNPTGDWQIVIPDIDWKYSIVRGMVSFGLYEIFDGVATIKFETSKEVVAYLQGKL